MRTVAIIQARMGSARLPGKVLADIAGTPMLTRIIERTRAAQLVDEVVVATSVAPEDETLVQRLQAGGFTKVYRGSAEDVLDRFFQCAILHSADVIVRVTADDPLKDPGIIDQALELLQSNPSLDYCSNTIAPSFPEGLDIEVFRMDALARANADARLNSDREHVTPYIWRQPELFAVHNFSSERNLSGWRWTVDGPADLEFARAVYNRFRHNPLVPYQEVVAWLDANPEIPLINSSLARNAGYLTSLQADHP